MPILFVDYTELVLRAYEERDPNLLPLLTHLTTANIKKECLNVYTSRLEKGSKEEEYTLKLFFGAPSAGKNFGYMIRKCNADRFRSLQSFLRRETKSPGIANVELLAWLIDFAPRPLARAQMLLEKINGTIKDSSLVTAVNTREPKPGGKLSNSEGKEQGVSTVPVLNSDYSSKSEGNDLQAKPEAVHVTSKKTGNGWGHKLKSAATVILITATTLGGAYFIIWPAGKSNSNELKSTDRIVGDTIPVKNLETDRKDSQKVTPIKINNQILRCQAITKKGTQCKRPANSSGYCWQHD